MHKAEIASRLKKSIILLDGATGTELHKRGMPEGVCPEEWCRQNPEVIKGVHTDYLQAGAEIIYTATFGSNRQKLSYFKIKDVVSLNQRLALLARQSVGSKALVAGDIATTGEFIQPFGPLDFNQAVDIYKEQVKGLLLGGVDLFVVETMMDIQEARAALIAIKELCRKFTMVTLTYEQGGRTLNGNDPVSALITLQSLGADAVGCNCSTGPQDMVKIISGMRPYATVPLVAKPNAGMPRLVNNKAVFTLDAKSFSLAAKDLVRAGAALLGGCCGTTPEHIAQLKIAVSAMKAPLPKQKKIAALSSARGSFIFGQQKTLAIVGEKINPTGKKSLQKELIKRRYAVVRALAKDQEQAGAKILDVNVGIPGIDERAVLREVISLLSLATNLPLAIDSSSPKVIEEALRFYPGRALINSVSGGKKKVKKLLSLAKKYGAMFIVLPLTGNKIPKTFKERKKIIQMIFHKAQRAGFCKDDFLIDALVMPLSFSFSAAQGALKTIKWCYKIFGVRSIVGLSNISFGLPNRKVINRTFLQMAKDAGLTLAIADPQDYRPVKNKLARDLLLNKDRNGLKFISAYSKIKKSPLVKKRKRQDALSAEREVFKAIVDGERNQIQDLIGQALKSGKNPQGLLEEAMIPAVIKVGEFFQRKEYFLPQLIASAEVMKRGVAYLEPYLSKQELSHTKKAVILLATVKGDIHDIGKNIVALMLKNHGFQIIDLGKDVSTKKIIQKIKLHSPDIVGLSALMTTTMVAMPEVIKAAREEGLKCEFMVGGAVLNEAYAEAIGAAYAKDGVKAVKVAEELGRRVRKDLGK